MTDIVLQDVETQGVFFETILKLNFDHCRIKVIIDQSITMDPRRKISNHGQASVAVIGGFFTGVMTLIVGYAVLARYVLNSPIGWSEEISMYLMVWAVFLGASYTLKEDAHIGVDVLLSRLGPKTKKAFQSFHYIVGLAFFSILLVKGVEMVQFSLFMGSRSIAVEFPLYIAHLSVPVGSVLLLLQCLQKLIFLYRRKS